MEQIDHAWAERDENRMLDTALSWVAIDITC